MIHQYRGHHPPCTPQMPKRPVVQAVTSTLRFPQQAADGLHEYPTTGIAGSHAAKARAARQASYRSQIRLWQPLVPRLQSMTTFSVGPVAPLGTGFFGWLLGYLMTMLTLSTPTNSSKSAIHLLLRVRSFSSTPDRLEADPGPALFPFIRKSAILQAINRFWEGVASAPLCP